MPHTSTESACTDLLLCLITHTLTLEHSHYGHTHARAHTHGTTRNSPMSQSAWKTATRYKRQLTRAFSCNLIRSITIETSGKPNAVTHDYTNTAQTHKSTDAQKHTRPLQRQHPIHNPTCCTSANTAPLARYLLTLPSTPSQATTREKGGHRKETLYLSLRDISHRGNLTGKLNL